MDIEIPDYTLMELLGRGGQGRVYRALCHTTRAEVAIKLTHHASPRRLEAFEREVDALVQLGSCAPTHTETITLPVLDVGRTGAWIWYAMPLMHGRTLDRVFYRMSQGAPVEKSSTEPVSMLDLDSVASLPPSIKSQRPYPWSVVVALLRALDAAHSQGFAHGDIKPSNIFMREDGRVVLADFGMSMRAQDMWGREELSALRSRGGTRRYMAPEQLEGAPFDGRADLYALGQMLLRSGIEGQNQATARVVERLTHPLPEGRPFRGLDVARALAAALGEALTEWSYAFPRLRPAFVGRRAALSAAKRWYDPPNAHRALCLVGEPGAGKTRTLAEIARQLPKRALRISARSKTLWTDIARQLPAPHDAIVRDTARSPSSRRGLVATLTSALNALPCALVVVDDLDQLDASHRDALRLSCARADTPMIASSTTATDSCELHALPRLDAFEARALLVSVLGHAKHDMIEALIARGAGNPQRLTEQAHRVHTTRHRPTPSPHERQLSTAL